jgi:glucan phosphoethanolaminetransferase (alkaline phosphatase superfamily)
MKQRIKAVITNIVLTVFAFFTGTVYVLAQDSQGSSSVTTTTQTESWYVHPWVWIVGAALFILILVALIRGGRKDSVTITKTTTTDSNV